MRAFIDNIRRRRKVLVADDEFINRELLRTILEAEYEVVCAENGKEALDLLSEGETDFSLVLLDLLMPVMDGFEVIRRCRESETLRMVPIIVMTSEKSAEVKSIRMGAVDFITKPYDMPDVILARCERVIELSEDKSLIRETETDKLTGLYTQKYFFEYIRRFLTDGEMDAVALDIDRFEIINEVFGREEGNRLLKATASLISEVLVNSEGIACRREADSFFVYRRRCDDYETLLRLINERLAAQFSGRGIRLRAGVCQRSDSLRAETRFNRAKSACDRIRNTFNVYTAYYSEELYARAKFRERLIGDVQSSLDNGCFKVYYQPKYAILGDEPRLAGAEALVRWIHPELGFVSPGEFIPLFEDNGLICKVDHFVWSEAAAQIRRWRDAFGKSVPVSVNVSRVDVFDPALESTLTSLVKREQLMPGEMRLEITESAYAENGEQLTELIKSLRDKGFKIDMDDFGAGYSSLNMLTRLPVDLLKIDMQFIRHMFRDEKSLRMTALVIELAHTLGMPAVAEGVEDENQLNELKKMGCDLIQGYYFSPPVPAEKMTELIQKDAERR